MLASLLALLVGAPAGAVDLNGTWRIQAPWVATAPQLVEITQTGNAVSFAMDAGPGLHLAVTGNVDGDAVWLTTNNTSCPGGGKLEVLPGEGVLDARVGLFHPSTCSNPVVFRVLATRCECVDGNDDDGDGCDARCQVEPCFTCSGTPSVCTPLANGAACDDRADCTTGTTCSGGACGGGSSVPACVDLTGSWFVGTEDDFFGDYTEQRDVRQRGGVLIVDEPLGAVGTINVSTRAMSLRTPSWQSYFCLDPSTFAGIASSDGRLYTGTAVDRLDDTHSLSCFVHDIAEHGSRCGGGTLDAGEACDDGNADAGDGCDASCVVEPCWSCTGDPSTCVAGPRNDCRAALDPKKARLDVRDSDPSVRDAVGWTWTKGAATTLGELADPTATSDVDVCVFGGASDVLLSARVPAGGDCDGKPCWRGSTKGFLYVDKSGAADGINKLQLGAGAAGKAKVLVRGKGEVLDPPTPPLGLPVRVQVQIEGGACFESLHGPAGVRRNETGVFKGTGTP